MERKTITYNNNFDDTVVLDAKKIDYSKKDTVELDDNEIFKELERLNTQRKPLLVENSPYEDDFFNNGDFDHKDYSYTDDYSYRRRSKPEEEKNSKKKLSKNTKILIGSGIGLLAIIILLLMILLPHKEKIALTNEINDKTILSDTNWVTEKDSIIEFGVPNEYEGYREYYINNPNTSLLATYNILYGHEAELIMDYYDKKSEDIGQKILDYYNISDDGTINFIMTLSVTKDISSLERDNDDYFVIYKDSIMYCYNLKKDSFEKLYRDNEKHSISNSVEEETVEEKVTEENQPEENDEPVLDENFKKAQEEKALKEKQKQEEEQKKKEQEEKEKQEQTQTQPEEQQFQIVNNNTGDDNSTEGDNNN